MGESLVGDGVLDVPRGTISFFAGMLGEFVTFHCRDVREAVPYKEIRNRAKNTNFIRSPCADLQNGAIVISEGGDFMKITFLGAAHEVTGSCTLVEALGKHIIIDCGMEQGEDIYENCEIPIAANDIDAVLLTHAHIDHSGKIPALVAQGYHGPIYATEATRQHKHGPVTPAPPEHFQQIIASSPDGKEDPFAYKIHGDPSPENFVQIK